MKKVKKFLRFLCISLVVLAVELFVCRIVFKLCWNFNLFSRVPYERLRYFWDNGGNFNTFRDLSLLGSFLLIPIIWFIASYKLYKFGFWKFILLPFLKLYRKFNAPKTLEVEQVSIKNLGAKDKSLDTIISEKLNQEGKKSFVGCDIKDLRKQVANKIEEN